MIQVVDPIKSLYSPAYAQSFHSLIFSCNHLAPSQSKSRVQISNMLTKSFTVAALLLSGAWASPLVGREASSSTVAASASTAAPRQFDWTAGWTKDYPIHKSCNATLRIQLEQGLDEAVKLAEHARDHILRWGNKSEFFQKYFGNSTTATPLGWYSRIASADKTGMLFRCDDPDRNCATQDRKSIQIPKDKL